MSRQARHAQDDSDGFESGEEFGWIQYFLQLKGHEFFCQVEEDYIHDNFNLTGLSSQVPYFDYALDTITEVDNDEEFNEEHQEMIENDAEVLYGLIHARYILTSRGLHAMLDKYRHHEFGSCPRALCRGQAVLPCGVTDQKNKESVKLYCPRCEELYRPRFSRHENIDGAYFGTTFAHLFFLVFPELKPAKSQEHYVARVFGFRLHSTWHTRSLAAAREATEDHRKRLEQQQALQAQAAKAQNGPAVPSNARASVARGRSK